MRASSSLLMIKAALSLAFALGVPSSVLAQAALTDTAARQAIVIDGDTGAVLFEQNADEPFPPASLAKLMTTELVFRALGDGLITPRTEYRVSEHAWRTGGAPSRTSTMFAEVRSNVPVEALVQGVIVQAANDAAIVLAEGMEGSEGAFAVAMNVRAAELGLTGSHFVNPTGLPADGQHVTARDLARLARHVRSSYPDLYEIYSQAEFTWNGILQRNRNPLLRLDIGATGIATGYAEGFGYALLGVAERDGAAFIVALGGAESDAIRTREARRLLVWAQESFERRTLFEEGEAVGSVNVYGGTRSTVPLVTADDLAAYVPKGSPEAVRAVLVYDGPLRAPVSRGDRIGAVEVRLNGKPSLTRPLYAAEDVPLGTFASRALGAVQELAFGWIRTL